MEDTDKLEALGRYRLVRRIGRGGMGEVWLAEDPHLLRQVALKVLPLRKRDDEEFLVRFEREARAAAALHHPHILPVHDYGQQHLPDNQAITYLVMSYVSGGSVDDRLKALSNGQGALTQDEALTSLFQVAEAIDYAHVHNIVHRDIKPANMLLRDDNWLLLTDFGIARILTDADAFTTGTYLGTPTYMAPEQAQGHAVPASDIYSLAVVAYQLFTGRVPFQADNPFALTFQHAFAPPTSPRVYNPALSPEFEAALLRGLAKDPAQRPRSATAYVTSLDQALKSFPSHLPTPVQSLVESVTPKPPQRVMRRKILQGVGIGAGVLLVGGGTAAYLVHALVKSGPVVVKITPTVGPAAHTVSDAPLAITAAFTKAASSMIWSPTSNVLAISSRDAQIALWDCTAASQSTPPQLLGRLSKGVSSVSLLAGWSPDGKMLAVGNVGFDLTNSKYETLVYTSDLAHPVSGYVSETDEAAQGVIWTTNNYLVTVANGTDVTYSQISLWNMRQPKQKALTLKIHHELPFVLNGSNCAAVSPDGSLLAICESGGVLIGRLDTSGKAALWQQVGSQLTLNNTDPASVAWSPDGRYVAAIPSSAGDNAVVGVWNAAQQYQQALPSLAAASVPTPVTAIAWSPTATKPQLALGGQDGKIYLWNVGSSPEPTRTLTGNVQGSITSLAWSTDAHWLAASYDDISTTILLWRM